MMPDDHDERLFHRAAESLRDSTRNGEESIADTLAAIRRVAARDRSGAPRRVRRADRARRRPLVTRGPVRFVAGLAAGLAFAAGLGLGLWSGWRMRGASLRLGAEDGASRSLGSAMVAPTTAAAEPVQFMFVAPSATRVALVGEFNDWDPAATPMVRTTSGAWHVALPLARGRHVYAFVVDGTSWVADPQAPLAPERWFGASNSVVLVNGGRLQ